MHLHRPHRPTWAFALASVLALTWLAPSAMAQVPAKTLTLTFLDAAGAEISQQTIPFAECKNLESPPDGYASVKASDARAALNLYPMAFCQFVSGSTAGLWQNTGDVANSTAIRWEGTAPANVEAGTILPSAFPPGMENQTYNPVDEDGDPTRYVMDASKGVVVVSIVGAVLAVGVALGIYKVYQAAQYVPPPKKPKKKTGLNTKKIKKKDAYFKKPDYNDPQQQAFERLRDDSPEPHPHRPPMQERFRDNQYSTASNDQWDRSTNQTRFSPDSVSIDMRGQQHGQNAGQLGRSASPADLIRFDQGDHSSPSHGHSARGRGGEVLVPMHNLDHHRTSPVRRSNSSHRSR